MTNPNKNHGILWCFSPRSQAAAVAFRKSPRDALDAAGSRGIKDLAVEDGPFIDGLPGFTY